jgi:death-on-curing protein
VEGDETLDDALVQRRLRSRFRRRIDYRATDPETTREVVRRITIAAYLFNLVAISDFGGRTGHEREAGLVELAIGAAFQTFGGAEPHPTPFDKAAVILRGITQGHPFVDGNKRTGFLTAAYYLEQTGYPAPAIFPVDEVVAFCEDVSAGEIRDSEIIAGQLRAF